MDNFRNFRVNRFGTVALAGVIIVASLWAGPAVAAPKEQSCAGGTAYASQAFATCAVRSGTAAGSGPIIPMLRIRYLGGSCQPEGADYQSQWAFGTRVDEPNAPPQPYCERRGNGGGDPIQQTVSQRPVNPEIKTDFLGSFLTGAPVTFEIPGQLRLEKSTEISPGTRLVSEPYKATLDFGDGTPPVSWEVLNAPTVWTHIYEKKAPITITLTVVWRNSLEFEDGDIDQLADITPAPSTLDKDVIEVWSALTEPR